jgi:hypothetical protein
MVLTLYIYIYIYIYIYRKGERVRAEIKWNNEVITGSIIPDYSQTSYVSGQHLLALMYTSQNIAHNTKIASLHATSTLFVNKTGRV